MKPTLRNGWQFAQRLSPHRYLPPLLVLNGVMLVRPVALRVLARVHGNWFQDSLAFIDALGVFALPQAITASGLVVMAIGIALRARLAWVLSLLLLAAAAGFSLWGSYRSNAVPALSLILAALLIVFLRRFNRTSLAAGTLFAILSFGSLMIYAMFGTLYFGAGFEPPIHDVVTAFYFSVEAMTTVGFGDIVPHSNAARMFTASLIILGITIFATSITAIVGPVISGNLRRIVKGGMSSVNRNNHYLIIGASPAAHSVYTSLLRRGYPVTVVVMPGTTFPEANAVDVIVGDPSDIAILRAAGAEKARAVLALRDDDAENAFVVLAMHELAPAVRTVAMVNNERNLKRLRLLQPDTVFSPQMLAGELLARSLNDEPVDGDLVNRLLFGHDPASSGSTPS